MKGHYLNPSLKDVSALFRETNWRQRKREHFLLMTKKVLAARTRDFDSPPTHPTTPSPISCSSHLFLPSNMRPRTMGRKHTTFFLYSSSVFCKCCCIVHSRSSWQAVGVPHCMCSQQVMAAVVIRLCQVHWKAVGRLLSNHSTDRSRLEQ